MLKNLRYKIIKILSNQIAKCGKLYAIERINELHTESKCDSDLLGDLVFNHKHVVNSSEVFHEDLINNASSNITLLVDLIARAKEYDKKYKRTSLGKLLTDSCKRDLTDFGVDISTTHRKCQQAFNLFDALDVLCVDMTKGKRTTIETEVDYLVTMLANDYMSNSESIIKMLLPLVVRIRNLENIDEFLGYQPMNGPVGLIYRLLCKINRPGGMTDEQYEQMLTEAPNNFLEGSNIGRSISITTISQAVEAAIRRLSGGWCIEGAQDAQLQHGIDIESEILNVMAQELAMEMEMEMLNRMREVATTTKHKMGGPMSHIPVVINWVCNEIARKTRRGAGNFAIVDTITLTAMQSIKECKLVPCQDEAEIKRRSGAATTYVGIMNETIRVYHTPYSDTLLKDDEERGTGFAIVGYKGSSETDCGLIYCPYVTLSTTGVIMDPESFQPKVGFMTRYGISQYTPTESQFGSSGDYYGFIRIPKGSVSFDNLYPSDDQLLMEDEKPQ